MRIKAFDHCEWHSVLALWPRRIEGVWVWLERFERRWKPGMMWPSFGSWEFRLPVGVQP